MRVALFSNRRNAEPVKSILTDAGFEAKLQGEGWLQAFWFVPKREAGLWLEVPAEKYEQAERFLVDLDASRCILRDAIRCPECKSLRVEYPQFAEHSLLTNLAMGMAAELGVVEKDFYCETCHFTWPKEGEKARRDRTHMAPYYFIEGVEQTTRKSPEHDERRKAA